MTRSRPGALRALAVVGALALGACGSTSLSGGPSVPTAPPTATVSADPGLVARLPDRVRSAGLIRIGVDASYPPNEFLAPDGKTVQGFDVDLFDAVAARFGIRTEWQPADFSSIITGVQGGKYDIGISSFTINPQRKQQVTMVSYFSAGTQWATAAGNPKGVEAQNPCGRTVAVQTGTVQETDDLPARQQRCGATPIKILSFKRQDQATGAVVTGKADAMLADSPVTAYAVKQSAGKLAALGDIYEAAPYGYVLPKDETAFAGAVVDALRQLDGAGTYRAVLDRWGVGAGAISDFAVDP